MSEYECEHGRRIGKCAYCEVQELQGELSDLEEDYKAEFNTAEDLRCVVEDKDAQIKKLTEALESMSNFNMKLIDDHNKVNPPWDCINQEHLHDAFKLLAEIKG